MTETKRGNSADEDPVISGSAVTRRTAMRLARDAAAATAGVVLDVAAGAGHAKAWDCGEAQIALGVCPPDGIFLDNGRTIRADLGVDVRIDARLMDGSDVEVSNSSTWTIARDTTENVDIELDSRRSLLDPPGDRQPPGELSVS